MSAPLTISLMTEEDDWADNDKVLRFLGEKLASGRLSLFLGAGASMGFGLPNWDSLTQNLCGEAKVTRDPNLSNESQAENIFISVYKKDRIKFARAVQLSLYKHPFEIDKIVSAENKLLSALGAIVMNSIRGRAVGVVTFNFDDLLEKYLAIRGFVVDSCVTLPSWRSSSDVQVLHQHGLLESDVSNEPDNPIVFTGIDFDEIVGKTQNLWRQRVLDLLQSTTPIFVGLSGNDANLRSMLSEASKQHPSHHDRYWGIRLGAIDEGYDRAQWKNRGVWTLEVKSRTEIPDAVFSICRYAAENRKKIV
jgi:hypothetical protein